MDTIQQKTNLELFIDGLIEDKGFTDLTPEMREEIAKDLKIQIDEFIFLKTLAKFTQEERDQFGKLLDEKKSRTELQQFGIDHIPDYTAFLTETFREFQNAYLGKMKERRVMA